MTVNVMDRIMSTSFIILDQNFNANYVDIMVFEPSVLFPPRRNLGGGGKLNSWSLNYFSQRKIIDTRRKCFVYHEKNMRFKIDSQQTLPKSENTHFEPP